MVVTSADGHQSEFGQMDGQGVLTFLEPEEANFDLCRRSMAISGQQHARSNIFHREFDMHPNMIRFDDDVKGMGQSSAIPTGLLTCTEPACECIQETSYEH